MFILMSAGFSLPLTARAAEMAQPLPESLRPIGEWEEVRRLVMVFHTDLPHSAEGVRGLGAIRNAYLDLIKEALPFVNVTVIAPSSVDALDFAKWVHREGLGESLRNGRLIMETFGVDTIWIRDYSALLARGASTGALYGIDLLYTQHAADQLRYYDDRMVYWLYRNRSVRWVRPPLLLDGGNFDTDGRGLCFTSTEALGHNRTGQKNLAEKFHYWLGCRETIFLEPIPAESTGHLDMFFKVLTPDTWVLGQYAARERSEEPLDHLESLAQKAMEKNAAVLSSVIKKRGRGTLIRMGMPRPHTFDHYDWNPSEWDLPRKQRQSGKHPLGSPLARETYYKTQVGFKTFVNSIYLRGARGEIVVVPSYDTSENDEASVAIYRKIYPHAEIIRMPSDYLIQDEGASHCVLYGMPE